MMSDNAYKSNLGAPPVANGAANGAPPCGVCGKPVADPRCPYAHRTQVDAQATLQGAAGLQGGFQYSPGGLNMNAGYPMPQAQWNMGAQVAMPQFQYQVPVAPQVATQVVQPQPAVVNGYPMGAQVQTFTPGDNPYAAGMAVARQKTMHWGVKLALTGGIGTFLLFGLFLFYEWWNGRLQLPGSSAKTPTVVFPPGQGGGIGAPGGAAAALYPGLPSIYLKGGFGWLAVPELKIVYVAHDATPVQVTQANAYAAENSFQVRYVLEGSDVISAGGRASPGDLHSLLAKIQQQAKALRDKLHASRHRFTTGEYSGSGGLKQDVDGLVSDIDKAAGMTGGGQ